MYEWRLELLFKYAGSDLSRWQNTVSSKIKDYNGNWGLISYIEKNNHFITDVHSKDIHINFEDAIFKLSWHELHYNVVDIDFSYTLLVELYDYFSDQNCDTYLNPNLYRLLEEEYESFEKDVHLEQTIIDEEVINNIESNLLDGDDYLYIDEDYSKLSAYDNHMKYLEENYIEQQSISWEEKSDAQSNNISDLLSELDELLSRFEFHDADHHYFYECSEYLSSEEYQERRNYYFQKLKEQLHSQLHLHLDNFLVQYDFEGADNFYNNNCLEYISFKEYNEKKQLVWSERKNFFIKLIDDFLEINFLDIDGYYPSFYDGQCALFVSLIEYQQRKQNFVQEWVQKNNLGNKPDAEQALAIGTVNSHVQVIARAGSGKTSTLVNRAIFLQKHCGFHPSEILLLAFNRKAAQEIEERLRKYMPNGIPHVMTFHALAYAIVHPQESLIFDDPDGGQEKSRALQTVIDEYLHDENYYAEIRSLMMKRFREDWSRIIDQGFDKPPEEIIKFRRSLPIMGIDGKHYKSFGEKVIADFLFEHDIRFEYEKHFWWDNLNYRPDFSVFLTNSAKKGIIIEYFGLKGDPDYDEMSSKKRRFWQDNFEWEFIELDPKLLKEHGRQSFEDNLRSLLQSMLKVDLNRLSDQQIWERIKDRGIDRFTKAMVNFVQRSRKLCLTPDQLSQKINEHQFDDSEIAYVEWQFLNLGQDFYKSYLDRLTPTGEEDFDGLMQRASQMIKDGNTQFKRKSGSGDLRSITYVMIDEYQDFSLLFYNLVQAIRSQNKKALFFCVGDDWQAINGFAGSDLDYHHNFSGIFSYSQKLHIQTNYRSNAKIVEVGNKLMEGKGLEAIAFKQEQGIVDVVNLIKFQASAIEQSEYKGDLLTPAILRIISKIVKDNKKVVILTRKNEFRGKNIDKFRQSILKKLNLVGNQQGLVTISTTHQYKGKESQAVIILDPDNYPLIHPDLLFSRIFGDTFEKVIDDERRLFYVALTRAKEHLFIIVESNNMPSFVEELTKKVQIPTFNWSLYPAPIGEIRYVTLRFIGKGTFAIRDRLKADSYKFREKPTAHWYRVYPFERFVSKDLRLDFLSNSIWSSQANNVKVEFCNEQEEVLAIYIASSGDWLCEFDNFQHPENTEQSNDKIVGSDS